MQCLECPEGCYECSYDNKTKEKECKYCKSGYEMDSNKNCINCGSGCITCKLDENKNPICLACSSSNVLNNNKCLLCQNGCTNCTLAPKAKYNNETLCTECSYNYAFNPTKNNCTYCGGISE